MKKISILALILVIAMTFTACTSNEQKLYNAFNKMQDVTSMESDMEIGFTLEAEGISEEEQLALQQVAAMVNSTKLKMHQRTVQNEDKTAAKAKVDMNMNLDGMAMDMNVWVDLDMSTDKMKMVEIIKMPQILMASISPQDPSKEYLVYDIEEMMNIENKDEEINFNELMEWSKELQPKMVEYFKDMEGKFNPGFEIAKEKEKRVVDGRTLTMYEVKLDDAALKDIIRYTANYFMDDEATIEFIKEYMNVVTKIVNVPEKEKEKFEEEINNGLKEIETELPNIKEKFNSFMDTWKDVKVLGEKGIVIEFGINEKGYITHQSGTIDLRIDLAEIGELVGNEAKGVFKLAIDYNSKTYNINNKVIRVDIPKVNEKNSINFTEMLEEQMKAIQPAPAL